MALRVIGGKLTRIRYFTHVGNFNSATIDVPGTVRGGDFLLLANASNNSSGGAVPTNVVPSGFTQISTVGISAHRVTTSWKLAVDADAGAVLTGLNALFDTKVLAVFRPNIKATDALTAGAQIQSTGGNPSPQVIPSGSGTPPLVAIGVYWADSADPISRSMVPAEDGELNIGQIPSLLFMRFKYYDYGATPADVTVDCADTNFSTVLHSFYFEMSR